MATPTDSTTVVSGKTCTRTRVSTPAASSTIVSSAAASTTSTSTTVLTSEAASSSTDVQVQSSSSIAQDSSVAQSAALAVTTALAATQQTSQAALTPIGSSSLGTDSSSSTPAPAPLAQLPNTINPGDLVPGPSAAAVPDSSSSDSGDTALTRTTSPTNRLVNSPLSTSTSSAGSAGLINSNQGSAGSGSSSLAVSDGQSQTNIGGVVGGVVGGFIGIAFISAILFLCVRRRRSLEAWKERFSEKRRNEDDSDSEPFLNRVVEKITGLFAKSNPYDVKNPRNPTPQSARSSVSSIYSVTTVRNRANNEPPSRFKQQLQGFADRLASIKNARPAFIGRRESTTSTKSRSPFVGVVDDPLVRNSNRTSNPFLDPNPLRESNTPDLHVMNPDLSRPGTAAGLMTPRQAVAEGLLDQQRAPQRVTSTNEPQIPPGVAKNPFESPFDDLELLKGSGTPEYLRENAHQRTRSATTALRSHPPSSFYTSSIYYPSPSNPFVDSQDFPPLPIAPSQPLPPNPPIRRPSNAYAGMPGSSGLRRNSSLRSTGGRSSGAINSGFFGEPGPSRPTTMFSANVPSSRAMRGQSDPFDLDRPEILGFGAVSGRREVRASVTRQNSKSNRRSSVPGWVMLDEGVEYERGSLVPGPLKSAGTKGNGMAR